VPARRGERKGKVPGNENDTAGAIDGSNGPKTHGSRQETEKESIPHFRSSDAGRFNGKKEFQLPLGGGFGGRKGSARLMEKKT